MKAEELTNAAYVGTWPIPNYEPAERFFRKSIELIRPLKIELFDEERHEVKYADSSNLSRFQKTLLEDTANKMYALTGAFIVGYRHNNGGAASGSVLENALDMYERFMGDFGRLMPTTLEARSLEPFKLGEIPSDTLESVKEFLPELFPWNSNLRK